ncbi:TrkH family potassium uptake protein [Rubrobacter calidifluminis]|uniref:TrkH family potassium uptake protein n=1 Tax=Rubrobacter calidifluminis TaxID=1392640 RepID=UPI0023612E4B|nr:potassium transporter TrkG [Rubrobacter calidifluminis]
MLAGTLALKFPASTREGGISWVDAFFVSVSASSVTGLTTVSFPKTFTAFGEVVVMVLMQLGGIGIMTFATLGVLLSGGRVGFREILAVREELGTFDSPRNTLRLVRQIAGMTLLVELVGSLLLAAGFVLHGMGPGEGAFQGVFHAIMAYCNSGFAALPHGDLLPYAGDPLVILPLSFLIVLGGLGFPVLADLYRYPKVRHLSLHSRLTLVATGLLIMIGALSVAILEWDNPATLGGLGPATKILAALFQGITPRTAGFNTVDYQGLHQPTVLVQIVLMFIGGGPISTAGGIKVTTAALMVLSVAAVIRGEEHVSVFGRRLPRQLMARALALVSLSALLVLSATFALMLSDGLPLIRALFEVVSAFGTVGLTLGVTPHLSFFGKLLIAVVMFLGRVGPVTFVVALSARYRPRRYAYPEEEIAIG